MTNFVGSARRSRQAHRVPAWRLPRAIVIHDEVGSDSRHRRPCVCGRRFSARGFFYLRCDPWAFPVVAGVASAGGAVKGRACLLTRTCKARRECKSPARRGTFVLRWAACSRCVLRRPPRPVLRFSRASLRAPRACRALALWRCALRRFLARCGIDRVRARLGSAGRSHGPRAARGMPHSGARLGDPNLRTRPVISNPAVTT